MVRHSPKTIKKMLEMIVTRFPKSCIADLLIYFPPEVVMKFLIVFGGTIIRVPKVEAVWRAYRNGLIYDKLSLCDDRLVKERLAAQFKISTHYVGEIFRGEKNRRKRVLRVKEQKIAKVAGLIFRGEAHDVLKSMEEYASRKKK